VYLLKNYYILNPGEDEFDFYKGSLLINNGKISRIYKHPSGPGKELPGDIEILDGRERQLIFPGFIQSHIHLCQTLHRNLAEEMPLMEWLKDEVWPYEAGLRRETMGRAVVMALKEIISTGTTSILDMGTVHLQDLIFEIMGKAGFRYTGGKAMMDNVLDPPEGLQETTDDSIGESVRLMETFHRQYDRLLHYAFCPRFLLSCSNELLHHVKILSDDNDIIIHTHGSEHPAEVQFIKEKTGCGNIAYLDRINALNSNTVIAHGVHLDDEEKEIIEDYNLAIAHCPTTNLKLGSGIAPLAEYLRMDIKLGLGCDGAPCNNSLSILPEMKLASLLQKGKNNDPQLTPPEDVLRLVTLRGAEIIKMADRVGRIEEGLEADLVFIDMDTPQTYNFEKNPTATLVYGADARNILSLMVRGNFLYRDGRFSEAIQALDRCFNNPMRIL